VLADEWVARILALRDAQGYAVSAFVPSQLYADRPTYIYGAAIRTPQRPQPVGGVAIVFDSEPQFAAMLKDALPRDGTGEIKHGAFGLFVERNGRVIACSDDHFRPGDMLSIDSAFLRPRPAPAIPASPPSATRTMPSVRRRLRAIGSTRGRGYLSQRRDRAGLCAAVRGRRARFQSANPTAFDPLRPDAAGAKDEIATFLVGGDGMPRVPMRSSRPSMSRAWSRCRSCRPAWRGA